MVLGLLAHLTPSIFFRRILRSETLRVVHNSYFFQKSRSTEIIRHQILIQTLEFLTRFPTRQDGVENCDMCKVSNWAGPITEVS